MLFDSGFDGVGTPTYKHLFCAMTTDMPVHEFEHLIQSLLVSFDKHTVLVNLARVCGKPEVVDFMVKSGNMFECARVISKTLENHLPLISDDDINVKQVIFRHWSLSVKFCTQQCVRGERSDLAKVSLEWHRYIVSFMKSLQVPGHEEYDDPRHVFGSFLLAFVMHEGDHEDVDVLNLFADHGHVPDFRIWSFGAQILGKVHSVRRSSVREIEKRSGFRYDPEEELSSVRLID